MPPGTCPTWYGRSWAGSSRRRGDECTQAKTTLPSSAIW
jgi:hypothetical protein